MKPALIVGGGIAGLAAAARLAIDGSATLVDRLPVVGGTSHHDDPLVRDLAGRCRGAGVSMRLGATALRWSEHRLLIASPGRIEWLDGSHLLVATGTRPGTPAELRLHGGRLGGVLNATVATHLLDARVTLGRRPVIVGMSDWAREVADRLHAVRLRVAVVSDVDAPRPDYADEWWPGWTATRAIGHARVEELRVSRSGQEARLLCDALILAGGIRPVRNIEGAISSGEDVTFVQVSGPHVPAASLVVEARRAADEIRSKVGRVST